MPHAFRIDAPNKILPRINAPTIQLLESLDFNDGADSWETFPCRISIGCIHPWLHSKFSWASTFLGRKRSCPRWFPIGTEWSRNDKLGWIVKGRWTFERFTLVSDLLDGGDCFDRIEYLPTKWIHLGHLLSGGAFTFFMPQLDNQSEYLPQFPKTSTLILRSDKR